ncbi:hypothetical protein DFH07DRAFT_780714 [Mycena maculata]|uniref:Uncharacterized protein n=1 Tax=Mycena maculata TaxID=230809 RepID=A0AAD7MUY6_9AGAR|nr:hypothetical protein DFH07DRAFT_780714 [Mycena maculata]
MDVAPRQALCLQESGGDKQSGRKTTKTERQSGDMWQCYFHRLSNALGKPSQTDPRPQLPPTRTRHYTGMQKGQDRKTLTFEEMAYTAIGITREHIFWNTSCSRWSVHGAPRKVGARLLEIGLGGIRERCRNELYVHQSHGLGWMKKGKEERTYTGLPDETAGTDKGGTVIDKFLQFLRCDGIAAAIDGTGARLNYQWPNRTRCTTGISQDGKALLHG